MEEEKDVLQIEVADNGVATVWLNRPHKLNAISPPMQRALYAAVERIEQDEAILAVVFRGRGGNFCAGADLGKSVTPTLHTSRRSPFQRGQAELYDRIYKLRQPTVAAVEGYATAGGFELMISCDFAVAAVDARLGDFHIRRGLFAGAGPLYRLPRMIGIRRTKELMMTGKWISGETAERWGLVNACTPAEELDALVADFCAPLIDKSPFAMWLTKQVANHGLDADTDSLITMEMLAVNYIHQSEDSKEGVRAFLEKRPPNWVGY